MQTPGTPYWTPPIAAAGPPPVLKWYRIYCGGMTALYVVLIGIGIVMVYLGTSVPDAWEKPEDGPVFTIVGVVYTVMGALLTGVFAYGSAIPRKPWAWIYGIVMICLGMTSLCCLPATIPLLIHWIKPETKAFFGRT